MIKTTWQEGLAHHLDSVYPGKILIKNIIKLTESSGVPDMNIICGWKYPNETLQLPCQVRYLSNIYSSNPAIFFNRSYKSHLVAFETFQFGLWRRFCRCGSMYLQSFLNLVWKFLKWEWKIFNRIFLVETVYQAKQSTRNYHAVNEWKYITLIWRQHSCTALNLNILSSCATPCTCGLKAVI